LLLIQDTEIKEVFLQKLQEVIDFLDSNYSIVKDILISDKNTQEMKY
jgi:hypothetical protein